MGHAITFETYDIPKKNGRIDVDKLEKAMLKNAKTWAFYNCDRGENPSGEYDNVFKQKDFIVHETYEEACEAINTGFYEDGWTQYKEYLPNKAFEKASEVLQKAQEAYRAYEIKTANDFKNRKSEFISCKNCSSKIALKYISGVKCPVCGNDMRSDTVKNKIVEYKTKIKGLQKKAKEAEKTGKYVVKAVAKFEVHC